MKTLTAAATSVWKRKHGRKETFTVEYKRRYRNGSAYVYESSWTVMTPADIPAPGSIAWKLDTTTQNTILASNVTLTLDNSKGKWLATAYEPSVFAADSVATSGYEPYMTRFRIQHGYILDDGTTELVSLFVGYLKDFSLRGGKSTITYTLIGTEIFLQTADAQNVSDAFTLENCSPATGDGTNTEFYTTSVGVWQISDVQQNATSKTQGTHYTISQLDETGAAKITMVTAPTAGHTMKVSGKKWKYNQNIETLIGLLCDEAGIGSGVRTINSVVIPGSAAGSKTIDSEADFEAGSTSEIDTNIDPGSITGPLNRFDNFDDQRLTGRTLPGAPEWTVAVSDAAFGASTAKAAYEISSVAGSNYLQAVAPFTQTTGSIWFKNKVDDLLIRNVIDGIVVAFQMTQASGFDGGGYPTIKGYGLFFMGNNGSGVRKVKLMRFDDVYQGAGVELADLGTVDIGQEIEWKIVRAGTGLTTIYKDGTVAGSATDNTYTTCTHWGLIGTMNAGSGGHISGTIDDIYYSSSTGTPSGVWISAAQDILSTPAAWGVLQKTETLNGGTITYATASSSDNVTYDAYVDISEDGVIQSALKRYFKIRATFTQTGSASNRPVLSYLKANFLVSTVNLTIANFKGKTCFQAIQDLAKIVDYEWGFEGDGDFFFRSKTVSGAAAIDIDQDTAMLELSQYRPGWDSVVNVGQVKYGADEQYYSEYNATSASEASPTSEERFSTRIKSESMQYLLANDVNLGAARARLIYEANYLPRARCSVSLWMTPQIDLADIVTASYFDDPKKRYSMLGDNLAVWGETGFGLAMNIVMRDKRFKVVGVTYNLKDATTDLDLLEIL